MHSPKVETTQDAFLKNGLPFIKSIQKIDCKKSTIDGVSFISPTPNELEKLTFYLAIQIEEYEKKFQYNLIIHFHFKE
jgi:hypothetical protein